MLFEYKIDVNKAVLLNEDNSISRKLNNNDLIWIEYDINTSDIESIENLNGVLKESYSEYNYLVVDKYKNSYLVDIRKRS